MLGAPAIPADWCEKMIAARARDPEQARTTYLKCLSSWRRDDPDNLTGTDILLNLADLEQREGRPLKAVEYCKEALSHTEAIKGMDSPFLVPILNRLAAVYSSIRKHDDVIEVCRRSLEIKQKCFGKDHYTMHQDLRDLYEALSSLGRWNEAETCARQELLVFHQRPGWRDNANTPDVYARLALACSRNKHKDEALTYIRDARKLLSAKNDYGDRFRLDLDSYIVFRLCGDERAARELLPEIARVLAAMRDNKEMLRISKSQLKARLAEAGLTCPLRL